MFCFFICGMQYFADYIEFELEVWYDTLTSSVQRFEFKTTGLRASLFSYISSFFHILVFM